ncbi:unnamed protein product [Candida verbasci]|uniref:Acyl-CoA thioesterase-like C-terminal domain-containing protein n=1 Tax=Candida verbasci TaxID=1227364 RepID=A0A9W4TS99_9ASCO|nr:unnamed protein product [Candida verbasci]
MMLELSAGENPLPDFEEAFKVNKIDEFNYIGAHPLRLPVSAGRGVYGGHMIAQSLLVAIESTKNDQTGEYFIPDSYHSFFINAGNYRTPMEYKVNKLYDSDSIAKRYIEVVQRGKNRLTCLVTLRKAGTKTLHSNSNPLSKLDISVKPPTLRHKYPDPDKLYQVQHTDFVRNAFGPELLDYKLCPEENNIPASETWLTLFTGLKNIPEKGNNQYETITEELPDAIGNLHTSEKKILKPKYSRSMKNPIYNYVGLADISDSAIITLMARVLHIPWTPSLERDQREYNAETDATFVIRSTLNAAHIFHYNAMSLDHHIYFHNDDYVPTDGSKFDVCKDWLSLTYQLKRLSNNRLLMRGFVFNENDKCIATIIQEGLTIMFDSVGSTADKSRL